MLTQQDILSQRLNRSGLIQKKTNVESVLSHLLGIQAQYPNYAKINLINRIRTNMHSNFVHQLEHEDIILAWGQRQTVHFYYKLDWLRIILLLEKQADWPDKSLTQKGYHVPHQLNRLKQLFQSNVPLTKEIIQDHFQEDANDLFHWAALFLKASRSGNLYFKIHGSQKQYHWYPFEEKEQFHMEELETLLLKKYFDAYGPATKADAAHFFGVTQSYFTISFEEIFMKTEINGIHYYFTEYQGLLPIPEILLLGKFDPLLLAYKNKIWLAYEREASLIWRKAGQVEAVLLISGKFAGTWRYKVRGNHVTFVFYLDLCLTNKQKEKINKKVSSFVTALQKENYSVEFV